MFEQIARPLAEAEAAAKDLIAECLASGDYSRGRLVMDFAQSIQSLRETIQAKDETRGRLMPPVRGLRRARERERLVAEGVPERPYPHFFIEGDRLVKLGQSRVVGDYYRHETPKDVFEAVVDRIRDVAGPGNVWTVRNLEEQLQGLATYHIYNVVAAAKDAGFIGQVGRGGYTMLASVPTEIWWDYLERLWPRETPEGEVRRSDQDE